MSPEERVHSALVAHRGREAAISAPRLCRRLGWSHGRERDIRKIIERHANSDWPGVLCGVPGLGYFFAADLEEIHTYRKYLVALKTAAASKLKNFDTAAAREGFQMKEAA
jgi:hypothetical protein